MSKISELSDGGSLQSTDYLIAVRSGGNVKVQPNGTVTGTTGSFSGNVTFADNAKAIFGAGSDLSIYHDGFNSYIDESGNGDIRIRSGNVYLDKYTGETMLHADADGAVTLYYDNASKLATTATGIDVTGTVTADGLTVSKAAGDIATLEGTGTTADVEANLVFNPVYDVNARIVSAREGAALTSRLSFETGTASDSTTTERLRIAGNGDIAFYEDTGTTPKFFWDASAESLGIGTSSPLSTLHTLSPSGEGSAGLFVGDRSAFLAIKVANTDTGGSSGIAFGEDNGTSLTPAFIQRYGSTSASPGELRIYNSGSAPTSFYTGGSEAMRIDSSGNLLVGKSTADVGATAGFEWYDTADVLTLTRSAGNALSVNRLTSDGVIATFRKDGTTVGSIGVKYSDDPYFASGAEDIGISLGGSALYPSGSTGTTKDNFVNLGASGVRFKDLYLSGGVYLGGTGAANLLDDYEEGSWTPGNTGTAFSSAQGRYVKIGGQVFCQFRVYTDNGATAGDWSGLPFSISTANNSRGGGAVAYHNENSTETWSISCENGGTTSFSIRLGSTQQQLSTGKTMWGHFSYFTG